MKSAVKKLLLATSIAAGMGGMFSAPALADSLKSAEIGGSAPTDYYVYDSDGTNTSNNDDKTLKNVQKALGGNTKNPGGNVELAADSEKVGFDFSKNTTLMGQIGGQDITLSSLTYDDWMSKDASGMSFAQRWFDEALIANGFGSLLQIDSFNKFIAYRTGLSMFMNEGGLQRFSDPNISYVNQDSSTGLISIGLAGHFDATDMLMSSLNSTPFGGLVNSFRNGSGPIQASEVVKVTYNGATKFLYSFEATKSGLFEKGDGVSHNGNYEVTLNGVKPTAVPEPSVMLGLLTVAGMVVSQHKMKKA
ncbi:NF038130 family PEP-CTERM protein [Mastigocoleus testarum]|uniref:PEP-CTERM domain protein n=1 Tax=Mastigocoleus testarum BC008 TaxID=371196 RepID=A0A0V7ZLD4_9CYAN|nr:NF038130 family PEP-CTERM protein [Mastigocoleus testarum]KST62813.1 PEP-CTERM domain protein [Mastigocoleus testarum BC008]KST65094.1 PEP-CTERM domain protein [Mastigocoleus testarum BC008]